MQETYSGKTRNDNTVKKKKKKIGRTDNTVKSLLDYGESVESVEVSEGDRIR